jgi:hypothetical protein
MEICTAGERRTNSVLQDLPDVAWVSLADIPTALTTQTPTVSTGGGCLFGAGNW